MAAPMTAQSGSPVLTAQLRFRTSAAFELDVRMEATSGFTTLFGPSGAGKSTVLACLAGLATPDEGEISLGDRVLFSSAKGVNVPPQHRRVGYVFQHLALFPHMTALENVTYGLADRAPAAADRTAHEIMERFHVDHLAAKRPATLSGGERQRVALARTLVTEPNFLLLDEPLSALDSTLKNQLLGDLNEWNRERGIPIIYVSHDRDEVYALSQRVVVLDAGKVIGAGVPEAVLGIPAQLALARIAGFENIFRAKVTASHPELGTMTCKLSPEISVECPLITQSSGCTPEVRVAIRAGDILLATRKPDGLSARNAFLGRVAKLERSESMMAAFVQCDGITFESHLTLGATASLGIAESAEVWVVMKTHSCHLLRD